MIMSNEVYDILSEVQSVWLPAIGTLYFALAGIWGFPYGEQIVGTITALVAFLGAILHKSKKDYYATKPQDNFNKEAFLDMMDYEAGEYEDTEDATEE